ncbi:hypothetical protein C0J52_28392 [Blattella germanica]|nr:hypothetical protein C0J52_28392 [Blattella germanica]
MEGAEGNIASSSTDVDHAQRRLCGYLVVGWDKYPSKSRWLVFQPENCKLYVTKTEFEPVPIKDIDIARAVFIYDAEKSEAGHFCIR